MVILYSSWKALPLHTRAIIAKAFGFEKKHPTHVQDNVIVTDGYDLKDIETKINLSSLQEYTGRLEEIDFVVLWDAMVARAEGREVLIPEVIVEAPIIVIPEEIISKKIKKNVATKAKYKK